MNYNKLKEKLQNNDFSFYHLLSTNSTMTEAKKNIYKSDNNFVLIADKQTKGIGRRGYKWDSPLGNIYCSIVIKNIVPINQYFLFSMVTSLSIKKTINQLGCHDILFKWPNDIFYKNKKLGGIILESYNKANKENYVIIGLGINFSSSPKLSLYETTYIKDFINLDNKNNFLESFFEFFFYYLNNFLNNKKNIIKEFKKSLMFLKKEIKIKISDEKNIYGILQDISKDGALILEQGNKTTHIYNGTILL